MYDAIEKIENALVQHGNWNDRIYLLKIGRNDPEKLIPALDALAREKGYGKIFAKVPALMKESFEKAGYIVEAKVPDFYHGKSDVFFMAKFYDKLRARDKDPETVNAVLEKADARHPISLPPEIDPQFAFTPAAKSDAEQMSRVFKEVFETYPIPVHDPGYISKTMNENNAYFLIKKGGEIAAVSSSEMDRESQNAEMTDFATLPEFRGKNLSLYLLYRMEKDMKARGIITSYTIARAISFGMNITFARMGYIFSGTLANNTNISGQIESMNVWYKCL
jgi:putative beta-lysine N-acetyltransferase